jgi:hypothetical protein
LVAKLKSDPQRVYQDMLAGWRAAKLSAFAMACFTMSALHDRSATLGWLERSVRDHEPDIVSLSLEPVLDPVRSNPRALAILRTVNLLQDDGTPFPPSARLELKRLSAPR